MHCANFISVMPRREFKIPWRYLINFVERKNGEHAYRLIVFGINYDNLKPTGWMQQQQKCEKN